jgi:hypothetical protein
MSSDGRAADEAEMVSQVTESAKGVEGVRAGTRKTRSNFTAGHQEANAVDWKI